MVRFFIAVDGVFLNFAEYWFVDYRSATSPTSEFGVAYFFATFNGILIAIFYGGPIFLFEISRLISFVRSLSIFVYVSIAARKGF